jgi:transcriptional regulator with XRE-family HTH domain
MEGLNTSTIRMRSRSKVVAQAAERERVSFGERLQGFRVSAGLSRCKLAYGAGIHPSSISRYESGDRLPTKATVRALCRSLDLTAVQAGMLIRSAGYLSGPVDEPPEEIQESLAALQKRLAAPGLNDDLIVAARNAIDGITAMIDAQSSALGSHETRAMR